MSRVSRPTCHVPQLAGFISTVRALMRFGAAAKGQPVYEAGVHLGRLFRTIFLIDASTNPLFHHEMQHAACMP
ncbi:Tn3 family transposase [Cupriavidus sp. USMAA2-4]|uniref:Tn3 family transposase n=1 Tax=Cupriavidus sp. USMAA2-4 TaxID=876364 RepID=UPI003FA48899